MAGTVIRFFISSALASSLAYSIPSVSVYTQPDIVRSIMAEVTSYNSEPDQTDDTPFTTASGTTVHEGTAACPYEFPFGTRIQVEGKDYICEDRMSDRFPDRFDIWMESEQESREWGVRSVRVIIS